MYVHFFLLYFTLLTFTYKIDYMGHALSSTHLKQHVHPRPSTYPEDQTTNEPRTMDGTTGGSRRGGLQHRCSRRVEPWVYVSFFSFPFIFYCTYNCLLVSYTTTTKNGPNEGGLQHRASRHIEPQGICEFSLFSFIFYHSNYHLLVYDARTTRKQTIDGRLHGRGERHGSPLHK
jgi:hypothetical protein